MKVAIVTGGISTGKSYFCNLVKKNFDHIWYFNSDKVIGEFYNDDNFKKKFQIY